MSELDETAKQFFAVKVMNGGSSRARPGGPNDGLAFFEDGTLMPDGRVMWITEFGLMNPEELARRTEQESL